MRKGNIHQVKSSSRRGLHISSTKMGYGHKTEARVLNARDLRVDAQNSRLQSLKRKQDEETARSIEKLRRLDVPEPTGSSVHTSTGTNPALTYDAVNLDTVLAGDAALPLSHAGGEFMSMLLDDFRAGNRQKYEDPRTRQDRTQRRTEEFQRQLFPMVDAYLAWRQDVGEKGFENAAPPVDSPGDGFKVQVLDMFRIFTLSTGIRDPDTGISAALLQRGLVPCTPKRPSLAVTVRVLEFYRKLHLRSPHVSIQPYVKTLCDIFGIPFRSYLSEQFSICYDVYAQILEEVKLRVARALKRDTPQWRLRNACPACTYKLEGEDKLIFDMLVTMDGNDSLKQLRRNETDVEILDIDGVPSRQAQTDTRNVSGDYYLTREKVDRWARARVQDLIQQQVPLSDSKEDNPCATRWTNMVNEVTARMWGIFEETGIFLALCRHGFVLVVADMVRSSELSKYPLAVVEALIDAFGAGIGGGYDIGCKFSSTLDASDLGSKAHEFRYTALVGSFHGHAHNRLCQLSSLATYVPGMGLEDLEGCERFFSKSNALASSIRHASTFHRKQKILEYIQHMDNFDTSQALSNFLVNNYTQALKILQTESAVRDAMAEQGVENGSIFHRWLEEERAYLKGLKTEPVEETLQMDYYQKLVNLAKRE
ncbi:hypothetical protein NP233_g931 [Leucocoprinus birnbaumii]|uniref:CxC1-like cysteine cluster associated with KDZ transposases domain-containing protein n=1 Tax=Leucocoprinus birnbaumii TaxID=56174 RepID=A0AAD5YVC0_9AGAR|nr:hypothetical protein NP233_g931 [Leucocoprinus birnbaumii]